MQKFQIEIVTKQFATIEVEATDNIHAQQLAEKEIENGLDYVDMDTTIKSVTEITN